jgi:hypothetical protein
MVGLRDDFSDVIKRILSQRVANRCSNPDCRAQTCGPQVDPGKAVNVGVAAHITAASPGGPRYDPGSTPEQRTDSTNGIWLCQNCAKLVDNDPARYPTTLLIKWKTDAESEAHGLIGKTTSAASKAVIDKWVNMGYIDRAGITQQCKNDDYKLRWVAAKDESELIDLNGWNYVVVEQGDGSHVRFKIRDASSVGGYLVLLKKKESSPNQ